MRTNRPRFVPGDVAAGAAGGFGMEGHPGLQAAPSVADKSGVSRQVFPPWLYPLPQGNDFYIFTIGGAKTALLAAGAGQSVTSDALVIPPEAAGALRVMSIFIDAPTVLVNVDWILRINGAPVPGWTFTTFPRVANNISIDFTGLVRIPTGTVVDVQIVNRSAAGPWTVGVQFGGWYWSQRAGSALYGDLY